MEEVADEKTKGEEEDDASWLVDKVCTSTMFSPVRLPEETAVQEMDLSGGTVLCCCAAPQIDSPSSSPFEKLLAQRLEFPPEE